MIYTWKIFVADKFMGYIQTSTELAAREIAYARYGTASKYSGIGFNKSSNPVAAGYVKQILIFPTALTDSECIALTTL